MTRLTAYIVGRVRAKHRVRCVCVDKGRGGTSICSVGPDATRLRELFEKRRVISTALAVTPTLHGVDESLGIDDPPRAGLPGRCA